MNALKFKILSGESDILPYQDEWSRLSKHPETHPEVVTRLCRNDGNIMTPYIPILVDQDDRIACMFTSRIEKAHIGRDQYLPFPKARVRKLIVPFEGIIGRSAPRHAPRLLEMTLKELDKQNVDVLELPYMDLDHPIQIALSQADITRFDRATKNEKEHWRMLIEDDFDKQMLQLGKSTRSTLRNNLNKFHRTYDGRFEFRVYSRPEEMADGLAVCEEIDSKSYHAALGVSLKSDQRTVGVHEGLCAQGRLTMFVLFIDKKPLAFINSTQGMDTRYGTHMGFDPEFSKLPLGTIILFEKIRHLISTGKNQVYDFGIGGAEYKNRLCSKMSMAQMRMIRTRGALSNPAYLYMSLLNRTSNGIKRLLKRAGMENASRSRIRSLRKKVK
jgi:hypothetical protein